MYKKSQIRRPKSNYNADVEAWIAENGVKEAVNTGIVTNPISQLHKLKMRQEQQKNIEFVKLKSSNNAHC